MEEQNKYPEPVEALVLILIAFIGSYMFGSVFAILIKFIIPSISINSIGRLLFIITGLAMFGIVLIYIQSKKYDISYLFRLNPISKEITQLSLLIGITLGIVGDELDRLVQLVLPMPEFLKEMLQTMVVNSLFDWIILFLGAVIIAAVGEELIFRGVLQKALEKKGDVTRAVLLTSISWALIHLIPHWAIQIFIMGVIIGFLAWRTNSVYPGIIVHAVNNFIAILFLNLKLDTELEWYLVGDHVNPVLLIPSIALLVWSITRITSIYKSEQY